VGFFALANEVVSHWPQIEQHYAQSPFSRSIPSFGQSLRAIELMKFSALYEEKVTAASGYRYALITDVASFFPTIYTHTIPWALHSKVIAKRNRAKSSAFFGNLLDEKCMQVQDGQTIGLPIGPDTSHIIAEIVAVAIDLEIRKALGYWPAGFRYVDDFFLVFHRRDEAERAFTVVANAVSQFELQLNPSKTRIVETKELVQESWKYGLRKLTLAPGRKKQRDDIHHFFESMFSLEKKFNDESLIKYGLKQISSNIIKRSNWPVLEAYLLKCGYSFPNTLQVIGHILATYNGHGYPINRDAITRFCKETIGTCSVVEHHAEVAWALWICKELGIAIDATAIGAIEKMGNAACTLIALDLVHSNLALGTFSAEFLTQFRRRAALEEQDWLLAYEAGKRKWLGGNSTQYISNHLHFGTLWKAGVSFYDPGRRISPLFTIRAEIGGAIPDFDSDEEIREEFEFDELDEEYFDSGNADDEDSDNEVDELTDEDGDEGDAYP
jgi:hypothetical protein